MQNRKHMKKSIIVASFLFFFSSISAQEKIILQDSLNIPVILVDGVEVQSLDSVCKEDIMAVSYTHLTLPTTF